MIRQKTNTIYSPGDKVIVKHYNKTVTAKLIRQHYSPPNAWDVEKYLPNGKTSFGIVNELYIQGKIK